MFLVTDLRAAASAAYLSLSYFTLYLCLANKINQSIIFIFRDRLQITVNP